MSRAPLRRVCLLSATLVIATFAVPSAFANHPAGSCIDFQSNPTQEANPTAVIEATLRSGTSSDCTGAVVGTPVRVQTRFKVEGANARLSESACPFFEGSPSCAFSYPAGQVGRDTVTGWIDHDEDGRQDADEPFDVITIDWLTKRDTLDCDDPTPPTSEFELNAGGTQTSSETYTCWVTGSTPGSTAPAGTLVFAEILTGINDPDSNESSPSYSSPDYICETDSAGKCELPIPQLENELSNANICFWVGASQGANLCEAEPLGENVYRQVDAGNDFADAVQLTWFEHHPDTTLDCTPEKFVGGPTDANFINCTVSEFVYFISFEFIGAKDTDGNTPLTPDRTCTVSPDLTCSIFHDHDHGEGFGTTTYRAWANTDNETSTVEHDLNEGLDEAEEPGSIAEPDGSDVMIVDWLEQDPSPSPDPDPDPDPSPDPDPDPSPDPDPDPDPSPEPGAMCPGFESDVRNHVVGTTGDDVLVGTPGPDVFCLFAGNDTARGVGGDDLIIGGGGRDGLRGGGGADEIRGGGKPDALYGQAGDDVLLGGPGRDFCSGGRGVDTERSC